MQRSLTWLVVLLVGGLAVVAIGAAIMDHDAGSPAIVTGADPAADVSLCDSQQLELSIRASGFGAHVAALRLSGAEPCDVDELNLTAAVVDRNGRSVPTKVAAPQRFSGKIQPGEELIATFDYTTRCRQRGPFSATVNAEGEVGSLRATAPVAFRRNPFATHAC